MIIVATKSHGKLSRVSETAQLWTNGLEPEEFRLASKLRLESCLKYRPRMVEEGMSLIECFR